MSKSYIIADNIISSLGFSTEENIQNMLNGRLGLSYMPESNFLPVPITASVVNTEELEDHFASIGRPESYTRFEQISLLSASVAIEKAGVDMKSGRTLIMLSTTKGSIDILEKRNENRFEKSRLFLWKTAEIIGKHFQNPNPPLVVSNACISGVLAMVVASRLIYRNCFDNILIIGADIVTEFVASGFQSFMALSNEACKPFDANRKGLNLGEAAGTIVLSNQKPVNNTEVPVIAGYGCSANDATHISAPSRTGEGLYQVISKIRNTLGHPKIDFISAHGTATPYNDEMEAVAISRSGLNTVPINSLKGYFGHTLGAAGIIESIASVYSMRNNILIKTAGYEVPGTTNAINIITQNTPYIVNNCLKLASGFGGCNAGIFLYKENG